MQSKAMPLVIAILAILVGIPMAVIILLSVLFQDEEDNAAATACTPGATSAPGGGDRLAPPGSFIKPVDPATVEFTSGFGDRWGTQHQGIDLAGPIGTPIYAAADGTVNAAGPASGFGQWVVLDHVIGGQLFSTVYGHIDTFSVSVGQQVRAGQQIATIGNRGYSTGPHLHWETWVGGQGGGTAVDPLPQYESAAAPGQTAATPRPGPPTPTPGPPVVAVGAGADLSQPLPASAGSEQNMQVNTKRLIRALHLKFGDRLATLGGWRADGGGYSDHPSGQAVDAMIADYSSGAGVATGDEVLNYVMANADAFQVDYAIWRQTYYPTVGPPSSMEDRGGPTANHMDHVHVTVRGGGFDDASAQWGSLPGGSGQATKTTPDCTIPGGEGLGESLAAGSVPPEFAPWLERAGSICPQIKPSLLAAQDMQEGGFQPHGHNSAGAAGYTQFIDSTWAVYGFPVDDAGNPTGPAGTGDRNKIGDAVMAQGHYMCDIARDIDGWIAAGSVKAPNGPTELYLAGYNAGAGAVQREGGFPVSHSDYIVQTRPYADIILANEPNYRAINR